MPRSPTRKRRTLSAASPTGGSFALRLQLLPTGREKVLAAASLVSSQNESRTFSAAEITGALNNLTIPPPGGISTVLSRMAAAQEVMSVGSGRWQLTPLGRQAVQDVIGSLDPALVEAEGLAMPGAEFAHVKHTVIPSWAAPPRWQVGISRLLKNHPFETNVFCMTRFPSEGPTPDPVTKAVEVIGEVLARYGLTVHLASDAVLEEDLMTNVGAYMWGSQYGIGIVENRAKKGINYNAVIELGGMIVTGRRCAILKDTTVSAMPTDLAGQIYKSVNLANSVSVRTAVEDWASKDLGLSLIG